MAETRISAFEVVLLIVGIAVTFLGFQLIGQVYNQEIRISWLMLIAIFTWLTLLVLFISLSVAVDVSKKQLVELKNISETLRGKKDKKF